ncbi:helix-turn-helix domain-containing protein [Flavobacterium sp. DSR3-2]|uniref:helix-turn-helix domain-containing protein n=1 Tax=Flavobacterium sp. DSR3-2 TaxID=2804634 RepID=UPI003CEB3604
MIKNEKQYGVTKNNLKKFQDAIKVISESSSSKNPLLLKLQIDSIQSQIDIFEEEMKMYEGLKKGEITNVSRGFEDLSCGIIESRIAKGYNQKQFAELLKTSEQQVQKYESENYSNISLKRLQEIVVVLDVDVDATFNFHKKRHFKASDFLVPQGINPDLIRNKIRSRGTTVKMCA